MHGTSGSDPVIGGRYRLERTLGEDATGTTWEAHDTALDRRVRIKVLRAELGDDPEMVETFRRDMRAAAQATAVFGERVLDCGDDRASGLPFLVFEWHQDSAATDEQPTQPIPTRRARALRPSRRGLPVQRLVLLLLAVPLVSGVVLIGRWLAQPASPAPRVFRLASSTPAASLADGGQPTTAPAATVIPTRPPPTATPAPEIGERRRVANTDGIGVALRASPDGERLPGKGYDEGDVVTLLEQRGRWAHIRGDDGRDGWVLAVTLVR